MNQGNVRSIGDSTTAMNPSALALPPEASIVVLCAEWCTQCRAFREVAADLPAEALHWVDIEDEGLDADELGITAFPSVAICRLSVGWLVPRARAAPSRLPCSSAARKERTRPQSKFLVFMNE